MEPTPLIIVQDGAVDELMSLVLAWTQDVVTTTGVVVLGADCVGDPTVDVSNKILEWLGTPDVPVALSQSRGVNAFPWSYRTYSMMANLLPMLNPTGRQNPPISSRSAEQMIIDQVHHTVSAGQKTILLVLSPMTPVADAIALDPTIVDGIEKIVWMGGALAPEGWDQTTPFGNIDTGIAPGANFNAEWNAYWDPFAVADIFASTIPLYMFPLNVTNDVMLAPEQVLAFAPESDRYPIYSLAGQLYSMVAFEAGYAFWDTVTTAYLGAPHLFTIEEKSLSIATENTSSPTATPNQGTISEDPKGHTVHVATSVDSDGFYKYLHEQWRREDVG